MPSSKTGHFLTHTLRRRTILIVFLAITLILLYPLGSPFLLPAPATPLSPSSPFADSPLSPTPEKSKDISAYDLLSRPVTSDLATIPKIIHQTWFPAGTNMSDSAKQWVETVKSHHPDWEYVLWDDESDEMLVKKHFPWFLETYKSLPKEINRADMARNFYMFLFGGMYADVDTEALRPVNSLFVSHDVALAPHLEILSSNAAASSTRKVQRAFMGRMAHTLDPEGLGAIPNGWMASPPGHPFWLLPVLSVLSNPKGDGSVEGMTGPGILGPLIKQYFNGRRNGEAEAASLRRQLCKRVQGIQPSWDLFCPEHSPEDGIAGNELKHSLVLLPREQIYPFSWVDDGDVKSCLGSKGNSQLFDPDACKRRMDVDAWPSYFITYCTHTW
ncbi:glycosyltransferase family 32 protein [Aspergillus stella-maris]|uniref:glycosyltransferase family 32 protein n=1 Tax=Aspergillus stella-maris TaxID=1810926 RepID=UPI003CCD4CD1